MSDIKKDAAFQSPVDANALSGQFDAHNGDFDTPAEFIRAYLNNDHRALATLGLQNMEKLRDVLEVMYPEIREKLEKGMDGPQQVKACLDDLAARPKPGRKS